MPRGLPRGETRAGFGGKQPGAGRPRQRLVLDKNTARTLLLLTRIQRQVTPTVTEEMVLANLVRDAWEEADTEYEARADLAPAAD